MVTKKQHGDAMDNAANDDATNEEDYILKSWMVEQAKQAKSRHRRHRGREPVSCDNWRASELKKNV